MHNEQVLEDIIRMDNQAMVNFLFKHGLISAYQQCSSCRISMNLKPTTDNLDMYEWRCNNYKCLKYQQTRSIRVGSFLGKFRVPTKTILKIILFWSQGMQQVDILKNVIISRQTLSDVRGVIVQAIKIYFEEHPIRLGGPGCIVQVDETMINHKIKAHRGRPPVTQTWLLTIVDTSATPAIGYACIIVNKRAETLIPIISDVVRNGSTIHSDELKSYVQLKDLNGYTHKSVCHKYCFVDRTTGVHTQNVESYNNKIKLGIKKMKGLTNTGRISYLLEFLFLDKFKTNSFQKILELLK